MRHRPDITRNAIAEHLPRARLDAARGLAKALSTILLRVWLLVTPAALIAETALAPSWPALLLIAVGLGLSALALERARPRRRRRPPVANLSAASSCVWKMDIEG